MDDGTQRLRFPVLGGSELGDDVDPALLAADQAVTEAEDVEDSEGSSSSGAWDAKHLAYDCTGHVLLEVHGVAVEEPVQGLFSLSAEVGGQELMVLGGRRVRPLRHGVQTICEFSAELARARGRPGITGSSERPRRTRPSPWAQ